MLSAGAGVFSERLVGPSYTVTQRLYMHRSLRSLIVVEVDLEMSSTDSEPVQLQIQLTRWVASYDLTFVSKDSHRAEVRYHTGILLSLCCYVDSLGGQL